MHETPTPSRALRCLVVWCTTTVGCLTLAWLALAPVATAAGQLGAGRAPLMSFPRWLESAAGLAGICCAGWLWAVSTVVVIATALGRTTPTGPGVPRPLGRLLVAACGLALAGGLAAPAGAAGVPTTTLPGHDASVLAGLALPDRAETQRRAPGAAPDRAVVVTRGDTLWSLAADSLPDRATGAQVSDAWHRIYHLNRTAIGPDPDLIHPGLRLLLPGPSEESR